MINTIPQKILDAVRTAAVNGALTCSQARQLGEELDVSLLTVGAAADELGIKIKNCQLGCF